MMSLSAFHLVLRRLRRAAALSPLGRRRYLGVGTKPQSARACWRLLRSFFFWFFFFPSLLLGASSVEDLLFAHRCLEACSQLSARRSTPACLETRSNAFPEFPAGLRGCDGAVKILRYRGARGQRRLLRTAGAWRSLQRGEGGARSALSWLVVLSVRLHSR